MFQFLFISGDKRYWSIINKVDLVGEDNGKYYDNEDITVQSSQISCTPYQAKMYRRENIFDDPFVSYSDHGAEQNILYKGGSSDHWNGLLQVSGGMYVYIKPCSIVPPNLGMQKKVKVNVLPTCLIFLLEIKVSRHF